MSLPRNKSFRIKNKRNLLSKCPWVLTGPEKIPEDIKLPDNSLYVTDPAKVKELARKLELIYSDLRARSGDNS